MRRLRAVAPALLAAAALAGCGGDNEPATPKPLTTKSATTAAPATTTPAPKGGAAGKEKSGGSQAPADKSPREAEADYEKYCETHPGACAD